MEKIDTILEKVSLLKPNKVLDVGCGCGSFTTQLSPHCREIIAIDSSQALIDRCMKENQEPNITYMCMDGRDIRYPDSSFDLVLERTALHHIRQWKKALDEMIRVSSKYVLVEEPIDDPRSQEKKTSMRAQRFFLELQNEVGYSHFKYIALDHLIRYFDRRGISAETQIVKSDKLTDFEKYFSSFGEFAEKSTRKKYWLDRLDGLRRELNSKKLCEEDVAFIFAVK